MFCCCCCCVNCNVYGDDGVADSDEDGCLDCFGVDNGEGDASCAFANISLKDEDGFEPMSTSNKNLTVFGVASVICMVPDGVDGTATT